MAVLDIKKYGHPALREKARELTPDDITGEFRALMDDMGETMYGASGIGLAANQVGELRRFFVADWSQVVDGERRGKRRKDPEKRRLMVLLNPEILEFSSEDEEGSEGCLSIPDIDADVYRSTRIHVRYRDLDWNEHDEWLEDLPARVFQHELDHLDGVLFIDRIGEDARTRLAGPLNKLRRKTLKELEECGSAAS